MNFPVMQFNLRKLSIISQRSQIYYIRINDLTSLKVRILLCNSEEGAIYIPPETVIELPSRIINFEELTHYAVVSHTADTHININWEWNPMTEMDLLVNIHDCLMESMRRTWGDAAHPHYPLQHEQHIDEEEFPPGY
jgi:hypothetical protein